MNLSLGVYERLVDRFVDAEIQGLSREFTATVTPLAPADSIALLVREIATRVKARMLDVLKTEHQTRETLLEVARNHLGDDILDLRALIEVRESLRTSPLPRPIVPLGESALVTNDQRLNYAAVLRSELASADRVDLICPFIGVQGVNLVLGDLPENRLRVLTTTYLGGTHLRALEMLVERGAEVRIAYESPDQKTALHAKAWLFRRESGFSTACLGSSNLSPKALVDGLEWNLRISGVDSPAILEELRVTFDRLWADPRFESFDPDRDRERVARALKSQRGEEFGTVLFLDVVPRSYQTEMLGDIAAARSTGRHRNLVVAATGTGKTLLAAFDYRALEDSLGRRPSLLFVAHREDILDQARAAYRTVLKDRAFGEKLVGGERPESFRHVFASVQSLTRMEIATISDRFDVVVIDEFHHAEAPTYRRLVDGLRPKELLGLTATPERTDGVNVSDWFGGATTELRLWHALERGLLAPFHYYGVHDDTDLSALRWSAGKYDPSELDDRLVTNGHARARNVIRELGRHVPDPNTARTVAFCASVAHAEFMAARFREAGLRAEALHSRLANDVREGRRGDFRAGRLPVLCTVDLLNEGVDVPEIDTILFLRPTESATVFVQQLGRGLRLHRDKAALTVLDFVGRQHARFRFDGRFRALTGLSRTELDKAVREDFPALPAGCAIRLDEVPRRHIVESLRNALPLRPKAMAAELRILAQGDADYPLARFLVESGLDPGDVYRSRRTYRDLRAAAGLALPAPPSQSRFEGLLHVDDARRMAEYRRALTGEGDPIFSRMLAYAMRDESDLQRFAAADLAEARDLLSAIDAALRAPLSPDLPFALHAHYTRDEIVAAFGRRPSAMRQGTFYAQGHELDAHLFTLRKGERFSPTTRYADYFLAPDRIHWESQSTTTLRSPTGQRYVNGEGRHLFFAREAADVDGRTSPFLCLGFGHPLFHEGERPIRLTWRLNHAVPDHLYPRLRAAAG